MTELPGPLGSGGQPDSIPAPDPNNPPGYVDDSPAGNKSQETTNGVALAGQFLERAYFTRLHRFCDKPEEHPRRGQLCFAADFIIRILAALLILTIATVAAWKSLSPLPWH